MVTMARMANTMLVTTTSVSWLILLVQKMIPLVAVVERANTIGLGNNNSTCSYISVDNARYSQTNSFVRTESVSTIHPVRD
jgi:hypothetical protein